VCLEANTKPHVHQKFEIFWTNIASTMGCPNSKNRPKKGLRPLGINSGFYSVFNSDLKVSSLYNTGKLQFKVDKNPMWCGSWMLLDALFPVEKGLMARP
jgi:hypothetical protein